MWKRKTYHLNNLNKNKSSTIFLLVFKSSQKYNRMIHRGGGTTVDLQCENLPLKEQDMD